MLKPLSETDCWSKIYGMHHWIVPAYVEVALTHNEREAFYNLNGIKIERGEK